MNPVTMIIIWAAVIALALLIEYCTTELVSIWFAGSGLVALILAAFGVPWWIQVIVFIAVTAPLIILVRQLVVKRLQSGNAKTNIKDRFIGEHVPLLADVVDGMSEIKLNDTIWRIEIDQPADAGTMVELVSVSGNKFTGTIVKSETPTQEV